MATIRAHRVVVGKPVGKHEILERSSEGAAEASGSDAMPAGVVGAIVRAIDRADAQGRGCGGCRAARSVARKMVMKVARPKS
jgi:hypothetical protein